MGQTGCQRYSETALDILLGRHYIHLVTKIFGSLAFQSNTIFQAAEHRY